jgi:MFS family permease
VQQLWNILYLAFNTACIGAPNAHTLTAFRFMAGLGASAPFAVGGGVISDVWRADERGRATAVYTLVPLVGPALGAICGGFITHHAGWRYCFAVTSITNAVVVALSLVLLRETYPPTILHRKAQRLRTETGNLELHTAYERSTQSNTQYVMSAMVRPFRLLGTQPIVQILALLMGVFNGSLYLLLSTFPLLWHERYNEPVNLASLNYLSIGLGFFIGSQLSAFSQDRIYRRLSAHYDTEGRPEYRIPLMIPAAAVAPLGLLFFGWAAAERWHWIVPNVGALFFSFGVSIGFQAIQVYLIDAYPRYAASAVGAVGVLRSVGGFAFPLFGPELFERLEFGKGGSIVAGVLAAVGIPGALGLWVYGARLRASYRYAAGGGFDDG